MNWLRPSLLALLALAGAAPLARADIEISIDGVDDEVRANALVFLSLERYRQRDDLDLALIERLQERAVGEVAAAMRPFGWYEPRISTEVTAAGSGNWRARIRVEPGRRIVLDDVDLVIEGAGADDPAFVAIRQNTALRAGRPLRHGDYDATRNALLRTAANFGYLDAKLTRAELRVDPPSYTATATLHFATGPRYRFGSTDIQQDTINESLARRYLRYRDEQPFDASELLRTQFALDDSQYFSTVEVLPGEPDRVQHIVPINIRAEPNRRDRYQFGIGYGSDTRLRGTVAWDNRRVNRRGHRFRVEAKAAATVQSLDARYVIPIGDPAVEKFSTRLTADYEELADIEVRSIEFEPSVTEILGRWQRVIFGTFTRARTLEPETPTRAAVRRTDTLFIPGVSYASVPQGYLGEALFSRALYAELRGSTGFLGSDSDFLQLRIELERTFAIAPKWQLLLRGQLGASAVGEFSSLPGSQRFFAGGDRSVRGFGLNELSPLEDGVKVGGKHLLAGTIEIERDLPRNFGVALFTDFGNAFNEFGDPLQVAVGLGFRWRLPVVSVGIDIAQPLTNPSCRAANPDPRCISVAGFDKLPGPRFHFNFSPKL
ncbi:MAG: BamA/TamA family outer membrane protein [Steroidobacteraceae bacterium]